MGWLFSHHSRSALIEHLICADENDAVRWQTLKYALRGNILWSVVQVTAKRDNDFLTLKQNESLRLIYCHLLQKSEGLWGYKSLCEEAGPPARCVTLRWLRLSDVHHGVSPFVCTMTAAKGGQNESVTTH